MKLIAGAGLLLVAVGFLFFASVAAAIDLPDLAQSALVLFGLAAVVGSILIALELWEVREQ